MPLKTRLIGKQRITWKKQLIRSKEVKRKFYFVLFIAIILSMITGCDNTTNNVDESLIIVNDVELHMDKEKEFKGLTYTITDDLKEALFEKYVQYYLYQDSGPNLLFFRIFIYQGKNHSEIRNDLGIDNNLIEEKGQTDNIEYSFIDGKRQDGTIHFYIIDKDNTSYVVNFVSQYDIKTFENKVLNSIKYSF